MQYMCECGFTSTPSCLPWPSWYSLVVARLTSITTALRAWPSMGGAGLPCAWLYSVACCINCHRCSQGLARHIYINVLPHRERSIPTCLNSRPTANSHRLLVRQPSVCGPAAIHQHGAHPGRRMAAHPRVSREHVLALCLLRGTPGHQHRCTFGWSACV